MLARAKPDHLESHQRDLVDEGQIAGDELGDLDEIRARSACADNADLDPLLEPCEVEDAADGFVERALAWTT